MVAEVLLEARVQLDVRPVVVEQRQLDLVVAGARQVTQVDGPVVGAHPRRPLAGAVRVLPLEPVEGVEARQRFLALRRGIGPELPERVPEFLKAVRVRGAVLNDE